MTWIVKRYNCSPAHEETKTNVSCGSLGCLDLIVFIMLLGALWFGLPTPWGKLDLDILPPAIRWTK